VFWGIGNEQRSDNEATNALLAQLVREEDLGQISTYAHEVHWLAMKDRPYLWGKFVWNMFDFAVDGRNEGETAGRNDKGLVSYDRRTKKDAFYWYKANWSSEARGVRHLAALHPADGPDHHCQDLRQRGVCRAARQRNQSGLPNGGGSHLLMARSRSRRRRK
jgi:hypothetical protein